MGFFFSDGLESHDRKRPIDACGWTNGRVEAGVLRSSCHMRCLSQPAGRKINKLTCQCKPVCWLTMLWLLVHIHMIEDETRFLLCDLCCKCLLPLSHSFQGVYHILPKEIVLFPYKTLVLYYHFSLRAMNRFNSSKYLLEMFAKPTEIVWR